jgi:PAS domain S-box-containing protein
MSSLPTPWKPYAIAVGCTAIAILFTAGLRSVLSDTPAVLLAVAVVVSALADGLGPGLLASLAAFLALMVLFPGPGAFTLPVLVPHLVRLLTFVAITVAIEWAGQRRRRAEQVVARQGRQLELVADAFPVLLSYVDAGERYRFVNKGYEAWFGRPRQEFIGREVSAVLGPEADKMVRPYLERALAGQTSSFDARMPYKDAGPRDVHIVYQPHVDGDGRVQGTYVLVTDISERKRAEAALRESDERFRQVAENIREVFYVADPLKPDLLYMSPAYDRVWGRPGEPLGAAMPAQSPAVEPEFSAVAARLLALQQAGEPAEAEYAIRWPDGTLRWLQDRSFPTQDGGGRRLVVGVVEDITERKEAERRLINRARQQAAIAEFGRQALAPGAAIPDLIERLVSLVTATLDVELCEVLKLLPDGQNFLLRAGAGWQPGLVGSATVSAGPESQAGYTLFTDEPVVVADLNAETRFSGPRLLREHGVVSGLTVIIRGRERAYGVLGAHSRQARLFTENDVYFLRAMANVLAVAIERQRAEAELRQQAARMGGLAQASHDFAEAGLNLRAASQAVTDTVARVLGDGTALYLLAEGGQALRVAAISHPDPAALAMMRELLDRSPQDMQQSLSGRVARTGQPLRLNEVDPDLLRRTVKPEHWPYWEQHTLHSLMSVPLRSQEGVLGALTVWRDLVAQPYSEADQTFLEDLAERGSLAIQKARLYQSEQQARQAAEQAADRLARLQAVANGLSRSLTPEQVAGVVVEHGLAALGAAAGSVAVLAPDGQAIELVRVSGYEDDQAAQWRRVALNAPLPMAEAARTGEPVWIESAAAWRQRYHEPGAVTRLTITQAAAALPLAVDGRLLGAIGLSFGQPRQFAPEERMFILALAQQCAQALDRARLYAEAQQQNQELEARVSERTEQLRSLAARMEATREEERVRVAREIHDVLGGSLTAIKMQVRRLSPAVAALAPGLEQTLNDVLRQVDESVRLVRRIATELRPALLDDFGLGAALEWQAQEFERRTGIRCEVTVDGQEPDLDRERATAVFRVFQEALTNVARHSYASRVRVTLDGGPDQVVLKVSDNGQGFAAAPERAVSGLGLAGMRERVLAVAGELDIASAPGRGTTVTVTVPRTGVRLEPSQPTLPLDQTEP